MSTGIRAAYRRRFPRTHLVAARRRARALLPAARIGRLPFEPFEVCSILTSRPAAAHLTTLDELRRQGIAVHVWCLENDGHLSAGDVVGTGRAPRFDLIRQLASRCQPGTDLLVIDDDVQWMLGTPFDLVALAQCADFALAQPGHTFASYTAHSITVAQPVTRARKTTFVEIGPVLFVSGAHRVQLLASDLADGMGYGTELKWADRVATNQLHMGVIDSVRISHLRPIGEGYAVNEQRALGNQRLLEAGYASWDEAQVTESRWWWWQPSAPWVRPKPQPGQ